MEQFNEPHHRVREKNVYLLHLDIPRIVLISMAIVGIMIASFLLGMNFTGNDSTHMASINENDPLLNRPGDIPLINPDIPEPPSDGDKAEKTAELDGGILSEGKTTAPEITAAGKGPSPDILSAENMNDVVTPPKHVEKTHRAEKSSQHSTKETKSASHEKTKHRVKSPKQKNRQKVVEVSSQSISSHGRESGFAIQVASFDSKSKANTEVQRLKSMDFDAYVDRTTVNGRKYYRVRIGPIGSHTKAEKVVKELHDIERYGGSYLIRE